MGRRSQGLYRLDGALSPATGQDAVRYRNLSEDPIRRASGTGFHGLYRSHGRSRTNQRAELWIGLFCGDFAGFGVVAQDGADPAYLPALPAGPAGDEISFGDEASAAAAGIRQAIAHGQQF